MSELGQSLVIVPTRQEAAVMLLERLPIVQAILDVQTDDAVMAYAEVTRYADGSGFYVNRADGLQSPCDSTPPEPHEADIVVGLAATELRQNDYYYQKIVEHDGYWWENNSLDAIDVPSTLREVWQVKAEGDGDSRTLDILNCGPDVLDAAEQQAIIEAVQAISDFTNGKLYDRLKGVIFVGDDVLNEGEAARYNDLSKVLMVSLNEVRAFKGVVPNRYRHYFKDGDEQLVMKIILAHEIGHAFDVRSLAEAQRQGVNVHARPYIVQGGRIFLCSAFDELPGWQATTHRGEFLTTLQWHLDDAGALELNEYPANGYAATQPGEDLAESFAIAVLGGDTSRIPVRVNMLRRIVSAAEARTFTSRSLRLEQLAKAGDTYRPPHKLARICLKATIL